MLYFKTVSFPDHTYQPEVEKALRNAALKKTLSLDFKSTTMNTGTDKLFFGLEEKNAIKFTRIRTSFEGFLPKLIIKLPKDTSVRDYQIRLGATSFGLFILLCFGLLSVTVGTINGSADAVDALIFIAASALFVSLLLLELKLTTSRVNKALVFKASASMVKSV